VNAYAFKLPTLLLRVIVSTRSVPRMINDFASGVKFYDVITLFSFHPDEKRCLPIDALSKIAGHITQVHMQFNRIEIQVVGYFQALPTVA
jgi:hypothetical protein